MTLELPDSEQLSAATPDELALLAADCLSRLEPGYQPLPLFREFGRLVVLSTFEVTPLRSSRKGTEVLLGQRAEDDPWWPSQWHLPGSVLLPTNKLGIHNYDDFVDTILATEFKQTVARTSDVIVFDAHCRLGIRGSEQTVFGWTEADTVGGTTDIQGGKFFNIKDVLSEPPREGLVKGHDQTIQKALMSYLLYQAQVT